MCCDNVTSAAGRPRYSRLVPDLVVGFRKKKRTKNAAENGPPMVKRKAKDPWTLYESYKTPKGADYE